MTLLNIVVQGRIDDRGGMCLNDVETVPHIHTTCHILLILNNKTTTDDALLEFGFYFLYTVACIKVVLR